MTVLDWLLDSDPAIRWQLLRDLVHAPSDVRSARSGNRGLGCQAAGVAPYEFFGTAFWIGFVLHLIAAEVWIQWTRPQAFKISSLYLRKETYHGDA